MEFVSDAPAADCAELSETLTRMGPDGGLVDIEPLEGRTISEALTDRGLRVDAVALDAEGAVIDPHGALDDLDRGAIRTVRPPERALRERPALLLRAAAAISATGLPASSDLRRYAHRDAGNILDVPDRRRGWGLELNKLLLGDHVNPALVWLQQTRVLQLLLPEIAAMVGFDKTCAVHHKDIWEHTRIVTNKATGHLVVRWAALCHDIGKVWTRSVNKSGKVHFFRHEEHGALLFESIAHRVGLDADLTERTRYLIENHSRVNLYENEWTDSAVRRLIRQTEGHLQDLITFSKADFTTRRESRIQKMQRTIADLEARIDRIRTEDAKVPPLKKGIGNAIIAHFERRPSRLIGALKHRLETEIEAGNLPERAEDAIYLEWLAEHMTTEIEEAGGQIGDRTSK